MRRVSGDRGDTGTCCKRSMTDDELAMGSQLGIGILDS
jgi:hypothetical protein